MDITVQFVKGQPSSDCKKDAYSVVRAETDLIDLIPAREDLTAEIIRAAFEKAAENVRGRTTVAGENILLCHHARKTLGF